MIISEHCLPWLLGVFLVMREIGMTHAPHGLLITWTIYGTFLPGDRRGWRHRSAGAQPEQRQLETWHRHQLRFEVARLTKPMRSVVEQSIRELCRHREWKLWAVSVRSNHVHVVVTARQYEPRLVREQLKGNATRNLRSTFLFWQDRPVWTAKGDIEFLDSEQEIEECSLYVGVAQDRKDRDNRV